MQCIKHSEEEVAEVVIWEPKAGYIRGQEPFNCLVPAQYEEASSKISLYQNAWMNH